MEVWVYVCVSFCFCVYMYIDNWDIMYARTPEQKYKTICILYTWM